MEVANESVTTDNSISLFRTTPSQKNEGVWVKAVFDFVATTTSNRSCEHQYDWNNNTTNISTTRNISKVGVRVKAMIDFFATKDCLSLFQRRNNKFTNKIDYLDNSNNDISELIFADINTFPNNNTTSAPTTFITHQQFETNNNHCIPGRFTGDYTTTSTATNTITTTTTTGYNHEFDVSTDISGVKG